MHEHPAPATPAADIRASGPAVDIEPAAPGRLMVPVADLTAHPGNVRGDLNLTAEFTASIAAEGVRIPLLITAAPGGGWRVIEGHRRLAAAARAGLAELPCDIDPGRAGDEAGQYLDMLLANSRGYRANYTMLEETATLFAAHEAGASRTRIRKATGRTAAQIKTAVTAGGLTAATRAKAVDLSPDVTLEDLALLADFDGDQDATDRLLTCLEHSYPLEQAAARIRQDRAEAADHEKIRSEFAAAGVPVTDSLPDGAAWLTSLTHDGEDLTPGSHAACPGHGATFRPWSPLEPSYYCTSPAGHGHASRWQLTNPSSSGDGSSPGTASTDRDQVPDPGRRLVITGNKAWQAAAEVRHRWLAASFFPRKSVPRQAQVFLARRLLAMPDPLRAGLASAARKALFTTLTGRDASQYDQDCGTATAGRLAVIMLAPVITAYEYAMTEGEGRSTWRTDRYSPCPRGDAGSYLAFLAAIGYPLSAIEQAVADGTPYSGDVTPAGLLTAEQPEADGGAPPGTDSGGTSQVSADGNDASGEVSCPADAAI